MREDYGVSSSQREALEAAQDMANHSDPRTTKLYDRRKRCWALKLPDDMISPASG
jgi:hypothetical protein